MGSSAVESISDKRGQYLILTPAQRFKVGKRAAEHGVTAALRYLRVPFILLMIVPPCLINMLQIGDIALGR